MRRKKHIKYKNNKSGFQGVSWSKEKEKWHAKIGWYGNRYHIGYFDDPEDAAIEYDKQARKLHKSYALLNFPKRGG